ncbi:MAG: metallophosphoesterase [Bacteroidetes bacterium]|nr:metallophosphoesterase [Bacteroidota bacterium]
MKLINQIIFFSIVLIVYGLINFYIGKRAILVVPYEYKTHFYFIFLFIVISYIAGRILEHYFSSFLSTALIWIGSFWMAFMFYFLLSIILIDFFRLLNFVFNFYPDFIKSNMDAVSKITALIILIIVSILVIAGHVNTYFPRVKTYNLSVDKKANTIESLNIVLVTDIHLGIIVGPAYMKKIAGIINDLKPDIVLLAGDVIDEDINPVIKNNHGESLKNIKARYGVFGITGNHEYIGGVEPAVKYLEEHNVLMLRDTSILIDNNFYLAGREDRAIGQFAGKRRKPLNEILTNVNKSLPIILMDHQPFGLYDAVENKIDLQVSGHTHNGQLWPLNYIVDKVYELGWGYKKTGETHFYVSCGAGGWGPPIRTGSRPEIVNITLKFKQ